MKDISLKFDKYSMKRRFGLESNSKINDGVITSRKIKTASIAVK